MDELSVFNDQATRKLISKLACSVKAVQIWQHIIVNIYHTWYKIYSATAGTSHGSSSTCVH